MTKKIRIADLPEFDPAEHLKDEEDIAAYLTLVIEAGDPAELAHASGVAARARLALSTPPAPLPSLPAPPRS